MLFPAIAGAAAGPAPYRVQGIGFEPEFRSGDTRLGLTGLGLFRRYIWKVYAGALYLQEGIGPEDLLKDVSKRLELVYLRDLPARTVAQEMQKGVEANVSPQTLAGMSKDLGRLHDLFEDAVKGDRCAIMYIAGKGTYLEYNGVETAFFENLEFGQALLSIWFGANPIDARFKRSLLTPVAIP
jgi:hypothetical protein